MLEAACARKLALAALAVPTAFALANLLPWRGAAEAGARAHAGARGPTVEVIITSADLRQQLTRMADISFSGIHPGAPLIQIDERARFQSLKGFGAAMTDTSAWLIYDQLAPTTQAALMSALFGASGIHLAVLRVPMGASDFTSGRHPWSYDDMPRGLSDPTLAHFSIEHDAAFTIPALQQALAINPGMFLLASPWSPPGWMKTNDSMSNPNDTGYLKPSSARPLAAYFVRFLEAYASVGVRVDAVTPQNEPGQASLYPGMNLSERGEASFVRDDLIPALRAANLPTAVYGYDWGWPAAQIRFAYTLARSRAAGELAGISTHCYRGDPTTMSNLHAEAPRLDEIVGECSPGIMAGPTPEIEIGSMRNWATALALWNLALDPRGGPVQAPNRACTHCTAIVTVDESTHAVTFTRDYYELGQMSRFVLPGAVRIGSNHFVSYVHPTPHRSMATAGLDDAAFENPDGSRVLVAYDNSRLPITFGVQDGGRYFRYTLAARSAGTFVWNPTA